ncbi:MAG: DUF378 domain-containing protein [Clostridiales bacterium]|nr:DUF378 domain-containing protein [Clostridiales bacterium]
MILLNIISLIVLFIGGINWGLVGIFNFNLVDWIFGGYNIGSIIVYILVLIATIYLIYVVLTRGRISISDTENR